MPFVCITLSSFYDLWRFARGLMRIGGVAEWEEGVSGEIV
jgi:hypothetical protein